MTKALVAIGDPRKRQDMAIDVQALGLDVLLAADGDRAIAMAEVHKPDLLICSLRLAGHSAYLVLERLSATLDYPLPALVVASRRDVGHRGERWLNLLGGHVIDDHSGSEELSAAVEKACSAHV